ncbi:MAG: hypothetical protein ABSG76_02430 [Xanthobacteraceae bacterium]
MIGTERRLLIVFAVLLLIGDARAGGIGCSDATCRSSMVLAEDSPLPGPAAVSDDVVPPAPAAPSARLGSGTVPASRDGEVLLSVDVPGRFAIRADSRTGVALQLVDMIAGPGDVAGEAGVRDGRLDVLLDKGTYKIRSFGAAGAQGDARLVVQPFRDADPASATLLRGGQAGAPLGDFQQRSYWLIVGAARHISVEGVGRALADLRLWRNGRDLVDLMPVLGAIEPRAGRPLTRARLDGAVEPGLYLVTAYGGSQLPWANGDSTSPFHIRVGAPQSLASGIVDGVIGPFGSAMFEAPPAATEVRVELPEPAVARLTASRGTAPAQSAAIARNSREPRAVVDLPAGRDPVHIEVAGAEGQTFRLRAMRPATSLRLEGAGPHLIAVDVAGEGGDEVPATVVLARFEGRTATVVASSAPRIAPGQAWRRSFNLRGITTIVFEVTAAGPVAARTSGPGVRVSLEPLLATTAPRADGRLPLTWDVEHGWYMLKIEPVKDAVGILDLTFGQPGLAPDPTPASPARTSIPLGIVDLDKAARYQVFVNTAPQLVTAVDARAVPIDLAAAPLVVLQAVAPEKVARPAGPQQTPPPPSRKPARGQPTGPAVPLPPPVNADARAAQPLDIAVRVPDGGTITVSEPSGSPVAVTFVQEAVDKDGRTLTVRIPPAGQPRLLVISWSRAESRDPVPAIAQENDLELLQPGTPRFFDLGRDQQRSFRLDVGEGGLHRIETLGRLKTAATIATRFLPKLDRAAGGGAGHNALLHSYLRAGSYRVTVSASDSSGHLGLVAMPAPLIDTATLVAGGSVRASLAEGRGAAMPIAVAEAGTYRLDLYGLGRSLAARLEDSEGWPITAPGEMTRLERQLEPGRYRLVVLPHAVDARVVARLRRVLPPAEPEGHGPHDIPFDTVQTFQWREPPTKDAERIPDRWAFTLLGTARIVLDVSDGMIADLVRQDGEPRAVAKIVFKRGFAGPLPAGRYLIEARSLGRNDRLDYQLTLRSSELQPGVPRFVDLPATIPFAIAEDRTVSLTSFGRTDFGGVLKDQNGRVLELIAGRTDDWNIGLSRKLAAGAYQLELSGRSPKDKARSDAKTEGENADEESRQDSAGAVEVMLDLPTSSPPLDLPVVGSRQVAGPQVHQFALPAIDAGHLLVVAAQSNAELVASLERQDADGHWQTIGFERDKSAVIAAPADGDVRRPWRLSVWAIDGGSAPITIAARSVSMPAQPIGAVTLEPFGIDGIATPGSVALVATPSAGLVTLAGRVAGLRQGSAPGRVLRAADAGVLVPQSERLWLLARAGEAVTVGIAPVSAGPGDIALTLDDGERATVPVAANDRAYAWRADSTFGQPGLGGGHRMGVAPGSAFSLGGGGKLEVWNAGGGEPLRVRLTAAEITTRPAASADAELFAVLGPHTAQPVRLRHDRQQLEISLAAGAAAVATTTDSRSSTVWSGNEPVTRTLTGSFADIVLINPGEKPAPVSIMLTPSPGDEGRLAAGAVVKRFFGAAGSLVVAIDAAAGDRLVVAGGTAMFVGDNGAVLRGTSLIVPGSGELTVDHGPGLVAFWLERGDLSPWPVAAAKAIEPPQQVRLEGDAMALTLEGSTPVLLHVRTTAPVILSLRQGEAAAEPLLFPVGAELHRYLAAGAAELRLYSPHDGPLAGALELTATPIVQISDGLGDPRPLAPGATALFGFEVTRTTTVGVGIRSEPDRAAVRLLDTSGNVVGDGVAQLRRLQPGRYLIEARAPADGNTIMVRPAVVGTVPAPSGPPPEVAAQYLEMVGLTPTGPR